MLREHTIIFSINKISEIVDKGCLGVIVYVYDDENFEVEFFDNNDRTISINTVSKCQIQEIINDDFTN